MKGEVTITFVDPKKITFGESKTEYRHCQTIDNEGIPEWVYIPASVSLKFGDKVTVSAQYTDKHVYKLKYIPEEK